MYQYVLFWFTSNYTELLTTRQSRRFWHVGGMSNDTLVITVGTDRRVVKVTQSPAGT
jgi:hypothetical protein